MFFPVPNVFFQKMFRPNSVFSRNDPPKSVFSKNIVIFQKNAIFGWDAKTPLRKHAKKYRLKSRSWPLEGDEEFSSPQVSARRGANR